MLNFWYGIPKTGNPTIFPHLSIYMVQATVWSKTAIALLIKIM